MKKIPYGIIDYKKIKLENYEYIDKTMYLEKLERTGSTLVYLRPGRFGKSLFTSMMFYYYDIKSKVLFNKLFKDTYVKTNPTSYKNSFYVLRFDFSGITTTNTSADNLEKKFKTCVITAINNFINYYGIDYVIDESKDSAEIIKYFLSKFKSLNLDNKLYILIDEYDNFTNSILQGDTKKFLSAVGNEGFVKSFYSGIKEYIGLGVVDRFFATGICPVTLNSMTTGFNVAIDLSLDVEFNSMIGLTHEEIYNLLGDYDDEHREEVYTVMMKNYDGYLFSHELRFENRVFNATLVMYLLDYYERFKKVPEKLYDKNITVNYEKIENIVKLQNNEFYVEVLNSIMKDGEIVCYLKDEFNASLDFTRDDIISLLYYFGYLTINGKDDLDTIFVIPNFIMKQVYNKLFVKILKDYEVDIDDMRRKRAIKDIAENFDIMDITNYVSDLLRATDNRIFMKFDEKYIQLLYYTLLNKTLKFSTYIEYPANGGYVDVMLIGNPELMKGNIMIEIKYIKKSEYKKKQFEMVKSEGIEQLKKYAKDVRINKNLKKYLVIFVGCDIKYMNVIE